MTQFPIHTGLTIATLGLLLTGARLVVPTVKGPAPEQLTAMVDFGSGSVPLSPLARHEEPVPAAAPIVRTPGARVLLDDSAGVLDHFYQALWRTEKHEGGAVTRIEHYGDSPTTADLITGDVRSQLQEHYGDAGHGFILVAKPWAWYQHARVQLSGSDWQMSPASRFEAHDGMFGLGGVSFTGSTTARTRIVFEAGGLTQFAVWYLREPGGGAFTLAADGKDLGRVETAGQAKEAGFAAFHSDTPATELELRVDKGSVRVFGITAEKAGPGVVYDSLGLNGASITVLSHMFNEEHWAEELRHRNPDLVIINYGTNEADFAAFVDGPYEKELREAIRRVRGALPETSILVMSPMDRGHHASGGDIETMATIPRIVAIQKRVASETGCGFYDTFDAMGGAGTMARWYTSQPRLVSADLIHPYPAGGKMIASTFTREIAAGLNRFKLNQVAEPSKRAVR